MALDAGDGAPGVGRELALGRAAHQPLAVLGKGHHAGGGPLALRVGDDDGLAALDHCHAGVGRSKVDSDHFAHICVVLFSCGVIFFQVYLTGFRMTIP